MYVISTKDKKELLGFVAEVKELETKTKILKEALEFYGDASNWSTLDDMGCYKNRGEGIFYLCRITDLIRAENGDRAREALAKIRGDDKSPE
jgi:hypothetical protein